MRNPLKALSLAAALAIFGGVAIPHALAVPAADDPKDAATAEKAKFAEDFFFPNRPEAYLAMEGKPAPQLALAGFVNGKKFTNEDLKGKITVVDLWATWCGPCIASIPKNNMIHEKYAKDGVVVLGVSTSRNGQEKTGAVIRDHKIKYLVARDPKLTTEKAWNVAFYPTYAIVDRDGIVRGMGLNPGKVEEAVKMLIKEQPAPATEGGEGEAQVAGGEQNAGQDAGQDGDKAAGGN